MSKFRTVCCNILVAMVTVTPVLAGSDRSGGGRGARSRKCLRRAESKPDLHSRQIKDYGAPRSTGNEGSLAPSEARELENAAPDAEFNLLIEALTRKGVIATATCRPPMLQAQRQPQRLEPIVAVASASSPLALPRSTSAQAATKPAAPAVRGVVPAVAPLRVLPVDPPVKDGLYAAFKMGAVKMTPYGFIKASAARDSSSPNGDDFPFVGLFLGSTSILSTGPTEDPEFHLKARSTRFGTNIEWPDISSKIVLTGRIEADFEGNFSEVDDRDVSSIRSNELQLRLAYARLDYNASDKTDFYFEGGQDWTLFGSSALPNIFETTFLGAYYGDIYSVRRSFNSAWCKS